MMRPLVSRCALAALVAMLGCRAEPTQLIVVVDSDIAGIQAVLLEVEGDDGRMQMNRVDIGLPPRTTLPFSFGVAPRKGVAAEAQTPRLRAVAIGIEGGEEVELVERRLQVGFVNRKTLHLLMYLAEACRGERTMECEEQGLVCDRGECVNEFINPMSLPEVDPRDAIRFDAGGPRPPFDASIDSSIDGDVVDAPMPLSAPEIVYPWNGVASRANVELRWRNPLGSTTTIIEYGMSCVPGPPGCAPEGDMANVLGAASFVFEAEPGRWYFRMRSCRSGMDCSPWSDTRYFDLGRTDLDTNLDGNDDTVIGAPGFDDDDAGRVWWYGGELTAPISISAAVGGEQQFGNRNAFVGDVNGDGVPDLAFGYRTGFEIHRGVVDGEPIRVGGSRPSIGVSSIAGLGDVDGDGLADYGVADGVQAEIYHGSGDGGETPVSVDESVVTIAGLGDLDADGLPEIALGIPSEALVIVLRGSRDRTYGTMASIDGPADVGFGTTIVAIGDTDGDHVMDFVVGAPDTASSSGGNGAVFMVSGADVATGTASATVLDVLAPAGRHIGDSAVQLDGIFAVGGGGDGGMDVDGQVVRIVGGGPIALPDTVMGARFGTSLASGDYDGDGNLELLVGAPFGGTGGAVVVYELIPTIDVSDTLMLPVEDPGLLGASTQFGQLASVPPSRLR